MNPDHFFHHILLNLNFKISQVKKHSKMENQNENFDLDVQQMIDKLLISDSDVEEDDGNNRVAVMTQPHVPQQQQNQGNEHNHLGPHQQQRLILFGCKRCHGDHLTRECPHGGSIHGIGRGDAQVFRTGGRPRCFVCRRYGTDHDSRTCPKRHPNSIRDKNICWGCGAGRHKISSCPERNRRCFRCGMVGHTKIHCWGPPRRHCRN